jgi:hypothetical protein
MMRALSLGAAIVGFASGVASAADDGGLWTHPLCQPLATRQFGPFLELPDGGLLTIEPQGMRSSGDDGATWSEAIPVAGGIPGASSEHAIVRTSTGVLVMLYLDMGKDAWTFTWDDAKGEPKEDCKLEIWAIRSLDGGKTWVDKQRVLEGYNAEFFAFIQTRDGRLVASVEHLVTNPGRWVTLSLYSEDEGKTWKRSNLIDIGGRGHHDGALEPTMAELSDGRLWMLIRTNLDRFWQAFSEDGGRYWRTVGPTDIDASTSPGRLLRLRSGRLALLWNQLRPEAAGQGQPRFRSLAALEAHPNAAAEVQGSWFREELSLAFSEDDGRTWTGPVVVARLKGGQLSYPYLFERRPGELWISVDNAFKTGWNDPVPLRLKVSEADLLTSTGSGPVPGSAAAATGPVVAPLPSPPQHTNVFVSGTDGYSWYRIPTIETAADGSLLAFAEARKYTLGDPGDPNNEIDLVLKRSTDGGATWSAMTVVEHAGEKWSSANASTVVDRSTGRIWLLYARCKPSRGTDGARAMTDDLQTLARTSDDHGLTWSAPIDLTAVARDMKDPIWTSSVVGPGGAIQTRSGRLIVPVWTYPTWQVFALFSDDHGNTWQRGGMVPRTSGGNEDQLVELADGKVLIDVRQNAGPQRWQASSGDAGQTWSEPRPGVTVSAVACAIERYTLKSAGDDRDRIVWTGPKGPGRNHLVLRVSYDEGQTFPSERTVSAEPAAYSDLTILKDKTVGVLWERGEYKFIAFTRLEREFIEPKLQERALAVLRAALQEGKGFEKVHAAEALLWAGHPEGVQEFFLGLERAEPEASYRVGIWRVLYRTHVGDPAAQAAYLAKIVAVFSDPAAKDQGGAAETLGKLKYAERSQVVLDLAEQSTDDKRVSARWILANSGKEEDEMRLAELLSSTNPQDRFYTAYALRHLNPIRPATLARLQSLAAAEPADGEVRYYVLSALNTHLSAEQRGPVQADLLKYMGTGTTDQRYESCMGIGLSSTATEDMVPVAEKLLDKVPTDERIGGAFVLLRLGQP